MIPDIRKMLVFAMIAITALVLAMALANSANGQVCGPAGCSSSTACRTGRTGPDMSKYPFGAVYDARSGSIYMPSPPKINTGGWQASTTIPSPASATRSMLTSPPKAGTSLTVRPMSPVTSSKPVATASRSSCSCLAYHKAIMAKLATLETRLASIAQNSTCDNTDVLAEIELLRQDAQQIVAVAETQERIAEALSQLAQANLTTNEKLDAALQLLQNPEPGAVALTVHTANNTPASYVDTSTVWAAQRATGLSHAVLVVNSADASYARLHPQYLDAAAKFPALKLIDVATEDLDISPTPQIVLYFLDEREPQVIQGDRLVASKLRDLYTE